MFGSALSYIALRILGEGREDGEDRAMARGRKWILDHGGLEAIPSWGKFWVTVTNIYHLPFLFSFSANLTNSITVVNTIIQMYNIFIQMYNIYEL